MPTIRERSKRAIQRGMKRKKTLVAAGVLTALEGILPLFSDVIPRGLFAAISVAICVSAFMARNEVRDGD